MTETGGIAGGQLRAFIERIERLEEEKKTIGDDIRDVYAEAKANGFDAPTMRVIVKLRKQDAAERQEREALLDLYMHALGMLADTELGEAAKAAEEKRLSGGADDTVRRATERAAEALSDAARMAQTAADQGLISQDAADKTKALARAAAGKTKRRPKKASALDSAIADMDEPVPLTEEEKAKGHTAAFIKDGTRMAIGLSVRKGQPPAFDPYDPAGRRAGA